MQTSSRSKSTFTVKGGKCHGAWICRNKYCGFRSTSADNQPNYINMKRVLGHKDIKACQICDHITEHEGCGARKLVEFDHNTEIVIVYHKRHHKCVMKLDHPGRRRQLKVVTANMDTNATAKSMGIQHLSNLIANGEAAKAKKEAHLWLDPRMTKRVVVERRSTYAEDENSFDAVGILKEGMDEIDKYYIYRINNGRLNGGTDYVFKTSKDMAQLAINMDVNGPSHELQEENAYFDVAHTRVHGFKTFVLWFHHSSMRKLICLATMEK